jgi:hypothetical protein
MPFYRFITERELTCIREQLSLLPQGHYQPYKQNEVTCVFESDDLLSLFKRYGTALAEQRDMPTGTKLVAIEVVGFTGRMEHDKSQGSLLGGGWPESRALFEPIPLKHLRIVGEATVQSNLGGQVVFGPLRMLQLDLTPAP